ncbi:DUF11 domain-containing protein [Nonomuraea pusilla]|uniref:Conserved repeat domain-containing protein n=1 Tax=Nonomuraea pusilla TaxID=46177 RepID=A0A1H7QUY5_9ACTN|nr:DUF11 domain-containing protein [Nonomuraea pusilla]SEL51534.1 conserved repeat domain-containing protein [Nonomuraea pusilla]
MRNSLLKAAALAMVAGALAIPAAPASASTATKADDPYSVLAVSVKAPKIVKRGGKITYKLTVTNKGPYDADYYWVGGVLPKGIKDRVNYRVPKGTECDFRGRDFWCWGPWVLEKGDSDWLNLTVALKPTTKGVAKAELGAIVWDVPTGMENLDKEEIDRLGFKKWFYNKPVNTKIVR